MYLTMQTQDYFTIHFFIQAFQTKEFSRQAIDKIMHILLIYLSVQPDYQKQDFVDDFIHANEVRLLKLFHHSFKYKNYPDLTIFQPEERK